MKIVRLLLIALLICGAATIARADLIDPKITIGGGGSCAAFSLDSLTQSFSGLATGCQNDFTNNINFQDPGQTLFQVVVNVTSGFTGQLSCGLFEGTIFSVGSSTASSCTFVTNNEVGLLPGQVFSLQFDNDPNGGGGFNNNLVDITISQSVLPTPEPSTVILLLAGTGVLLLLRRRS